MNSMCFCIVHSPLVRDSCNAIHAIWAPGDAKPAASLAAFSNCSHVQDALLRCIDQGAVDFLIKLSGYGSHIFVAVLAEE